MAANNSDDQSLQEYAHQPIDPQKTQIRLLQIINSDPDVFSLTLRTFDLENCPPYVALSYTWGPPNPTRSIQIDGCIFKIRENLWEFLHNVRHVRKRVLKLGPDGTEKADLQGTFFWIDQICIQQSSHVERNHQVGMMGRIFREAGEVIVWLGRLNVNQDATFSEEDEMLIELCRRPYWNRLWIIQEIMVARKIDILLGDALVDWECFFQLPIATQSDQRSSSDFFARIFEAAGFGVPSGVIRIDKRKSLDSSDSSSWGFGAPLTESPTSPGSVASVQESHLGSPRRLSQSLPASPLPGGIPIRKQESVDIMQSIHSWPPLFPPRDVMGLGRQESYIHSNGNSRLLPELSTIMNRMDYPRRPHPSLLGRPPVDSLNSANHSLRFRLPKPLSELPSPADSLSFTGYSFRSQLSDLSSGPSPGISSDLPPELPSPGDSLDSTRYPFRPFRSHLSELPAIVLSIFNERKLFQSKGQGNSLSYVLELFSFQGSGCENARDKVYGLLGLIKPNIAIEIDYQRSVEEVYRNVLNKIIREESYLTREEIVEFSLLLKSSMALHDLERKEVKDFVIQAKKKEEADWDAYLDTSFQVVKSRVTQFLAQFCKQDGDLDPAVASIIQDCHAKLEWKYNACRTQILRQGYYEEPRQELERLVENQCDVEEKGLKTLAMETLCKTVNLFVDPARPPEVSLTSMWGNPFATRFTKRRLETTISPQPSVVPENIQQLCRKLREAGYGVSNDQISEQGDSDVQ